MKHIPNILTIIRLFLFPIFAIVYFSEIDSAHIYALIIFLFASFTDFLDGYLARKYDVISVIGIVLDPLADKLMLITALMCLYISDALPLWILIIVLLKESMMIVTSTILYFRKEKTVVPSNKFGKLATIIFTFAIFMLIILPGHTVSYSIAIIAVILKLTAFLSYISNYFKNVRVQQSLKQQKV